MLPFDFSLTKIFETETGHEKFGLFTILENELPISEVVVDAQNWTLITTRQIVSCMDGTIKAKQAKDVNGWKWNDFKGYNKSLYNMGQIKFSAMESLNIFIETKRASMVTIYAIMTLVGQLQSQTGQSS